MKRVSRIFSIILDLLFIIILLQLNSLGIIPNKYFIIIFIVLLIHSIVYTILNFKKQNIIVLILTTILIIGSLGAIYYINATNNFFNNIEEINEKSVYYVIVDSKSDYYEINDLNNKKIGIFKNRADSYNKSLEKLSEKIEYDTQEFDNINILLKELLENNIDSIIINSNNYDMLCENILDLKNNTRIIDTIEIPIKPITIENNNKDIFNIYISGIDRAGHISIASLSDVNIVLTVNTKTHKILITWIPRDYYVYLHGIDSQKDKLTHAAIYGVEMSMNTVEDILDIDIDYYLRVNFDTLINLVNALGGVDVYNEVEFTSGNFYYNQGWNHLDGKYALVFARERKVFAEGDRMRGYHQEQIIEALINKISKSQVILSNYPQIVQELSNFFQTNIPEGIIKDNIKNQLDKMPDWQIEMIRLNGSDDEQYTYSAPGWLLYVVQPDLDTIKNAHDKITNLMQEK